MDLTTCIKFSVPSQSSCEAYCTAQTSCEGYIYSANSSNLLLSLVYYYGSPVSHNLCLFIQSDKNCPSTFQHEESRYMELRINWLIMSTGAFSCYGKNSGTRSSY